MMRIRTPRPAPRQRGVAVITALLLTTLAVSIVASLFWQQQVQVRSMENQRLHLQTRWILRGALDWAALVLYQDGVDHRDYTALDQVWATPLADTRLDQYIERDRVEGENFDANLSGNISDACARYNLRNLADGGRVDADQRTIFQRLLQNLGLDQSLAARTADFVAKGQPVAETASTDGTSSTSTTTSSSTSSTSSSTTTTSSSSNMVTAGNTTTGLPMKLLQVDDLLAVQGYTQAMVERLRPFVIVLPERAPVNVNTAPAEVLAAVVPSMSVSEANALVVRRKQAAWRDISYFNTEINSETRPLANGAAAVHSDWFLVDSRIRLDRAALDAEALIHRPPVLVAGGVPSVAWIRQQ